MVRDSINCGNMLCYIVVADVHGIFSASFPGQPEAGIRDIKLIWILMKQQLMGQQWTICKSFTPHSRQITMAAHHHCKYDLIVGWEFY